MLLVDLFVVWFRVGDGSLVFVIGGIVFLLLEFVLSLNRLL